MKDNSSREPFDVIMNRQNPMVFRIQQVPGFIPIINLLVIGSSLVLFFIVNSYFVIHITRVYDKSVFTTVTDTFSCDNYYCDETSYNFMNYYTYYTTCNPTNCQNIICDSYDCSDNGNYDQNYYYACQPKCGNLSTFDIPDSMYTAYILSILSLVFFSTAVLLGLIFGPVLACCGEGLFCEEKTSLILMALWPKFKYYILRRRQDWQGFYLNFRALVTIDIIINVCYGVTLSLYIYLYFAEFWQSGVQIANFYLLIWAYLIRVSMMIEMTTPICHHASKLEDIRENYIES